MKKSCSTILIYRYQPPAEAGLRARWWNTAEDRPHLSPHLWGGNPDFNGHPLPTNDSPDFDVINNSTNVNDSSSGAGAAKYGIISGWIFLPEGTTHLRDNNTNTGELGYVLTGNCCGDNLVKQAGGNEEVSTVTVDRTLMDSVPMSGGWVEIYNPQSDSSQFQGLDLEYSIDNEESWNEVTVMRPDAPVVECIEHLQCDPIPEGWQRKPLSECCPSQYVAETELDADAINALVIHPDPIPIPDQEICDGSFVQRTSRTGWLFPWTDSLTANSGTITDDWVQVSTTETSPDCITDLEVNVFAGNHYFQIDSARIYHWIDFRLLVNGVAVVTETYDHYEYLDDRNETVDTTNPLKLKIRTGGSWFAERKNVPAGATVSVEMRRRYNFNAFQTGGRARAIGGLRAKALFDFSPQEIVTGRV